jgi:hypothetical protein
VNASGVPFRGAGFRGDRAGLQRGSGEKRLRVFVMAPSPTSGASTRPGAVQVLTLSLTTKPFVTGSVMVADRVTEFLQLHYDDRKRFPNIEIRRREIV